MSVTSWALSGNPLEEAVVSSKSGHVFEKRIIEKHIENTGQCPITGQDLEKKDLIPLKGNFFDYSNPFNIVERVNKPKSLTETGIPGIMNILQTEWDSIILETYTLRKNLETVKNQLSHALYQKEAACRVIARLKQERDEVRQALAMTQEQLADFKSNPHFAANLMRGDSDNKENINFKYEQENSGIYPELASQMDDLSNELYSERKKDKKPKDYYKPADFESITESGSYPLHSSSTPGILCLDVHTKHWNYVCTGGADGTAVIFDVNSKKVITKLINENNNEKIRGVEFTKSGVLVTKSDGIAEYWSIDYASQDSELRQEIKGYHGIIASAHPLDPYFIYGVSNNSWGMYNMETGLRLCEIPVEEEANLTSITVHPDGLMMATGWSNGAISIWDIRSQNKVATMCDHKSPVTSLKFSNKGIHLASGCEKENVVLLYNLKNRMQDPPQKLTHAQNSAVRSIDFDKYGTYLVTAADKSLNFFQVTNPDNVITSFEAHQEQINQVKFSKDSSYIASVSDDRFLKIFSL